MHSVCFLNEVGTKMYGSCVVFNILTIFCYIIIWNLLKRVKGKKNNKKLFKRIVSRKVQK